MVLMAKVAVSGSRDGGDGNDRNSRSSRSSRNRDNTDRNSGDSMDYEVEQMRRMDGEETMLAALELGTEVTDEENYLSCSLFTRTQYRVFILWYEYPTRLFSLHIYKENERMAIRK
jgi:hypothetical protein